MSNPSKSAGLRIAVIRDARWPWRWQQWLIDALVLEGHSVRVCATGTAARMPSALRLLLALERLLYREAGEHASDLLSAAETAAVPSLAEVDAKQCDLVVDLAGDTRPGDVGCRILRPLYDDTTGDAALIDRLLDGHLPFLSIDDSRLDKPVRIGLTAVEQPQILLRALNNVYSRMAGSLLRYIVHSVAPSHDQELARAAMLSGETPHCPVSVRTASFVASQFVAKLRNRLRKLVETGPRWGVGWRLSGDVSVRQGYSLDIGDFHRLADDGRRFYADPFTIRHGGLHHVFVEDYPFATGRGVISHFTVDDNGHVSQPHMVLSRPYHLSYPFVFEHAGDIWMIPETSAQKTVELYRAQSFPDLWTLEKVLIEGVAFEDATPMQHAGRWWLFGAVSDWQSSRWDALGIYYAADLLGPWHPHQGNPVLLDARCARPAGAMFHRNGQLWRPVQDCSTGYGAGLALARVDRLDEQGFAQTVVQHYSPAGRNGLTGLHTLNGHQGLEVIDFYGTI